MKHLKLLEETTSPTFGPEDPVKKKPRFQSKPDRKHKLFVKHELVAAIIDSYKVLISTLFMDFFLHFGMICL